MLNSRHPRPRIAWRSASCSTPTRICADRRDAEGQKALFTDDTVFAVYMDGEGDIRLARA
jgi:hypothetical protein